MEKQRVWMKRIIQKEYLPLLVFAGIQLVYHIIMKEPQDSDAMWFFSKQLDGKTGNGILFGGGFFVPVPNLGSKDSGMDCDGGELYMAAGAWGIFPSWRGTCLLWEKNTRFAVGIVRVLGVIWGKY